MQRKERKGVRAKTLFNVNNHHLSYPSGSHGTFLLRELFFIAFVDGLKGGCLGNNSSN
jgi:hypothetical protein